MAFHSCSGTRWINDNWLVIGQIHRDHGWFEILLWFQGRARVPLRKVSLLDSKRKRPHRETVPGINSVPDGDKNRESLWFTVFYALDCCLPTGSSGHHRSVRDFAQKCIVFTVRHADVSTALHQIEKITSILRSSFEVRGLQHHCICRKRRHKPDVKSLSNVQKITDKRWRSSHREVDGTLFLGSADSRTTDLSASRRCAFRLSPYCSKKEEPDVLNWQLFIFPIVEVFLLETCANIWANVGRLAWCGDQTIINYPWRLFANRDFWERRYFFVHVFFSVVKKLHATTQK